MTDFCEVSLEELEEVSGGGFWGKAAEFVAGYVLGKALDAAIGYMASNPGYMPNSQNSYAAWALNSGPWGGPY